MHNIITSKATEKHKISTAKKSSIHHSRKLFLYKFSCSFVFKCIPSQILLKKKHSFLQEITLSFEIKVQILYKKQTIEVSELSAQMAAAPLSAWPWEILGSHKVYIFDHSVLLWSKFLQRVVACYVFALQFMYIFFCL